MPGTVLKCVGASAGASGASRQVNHAIQPSHRLALPRWSASQGAKLQAPCGYHQSPRPLSSPGWVHFEAVHHVGACTQQCHACTHALRLSAAVAQRAEAPEGR
eukprot:1759779-Amphidinium_carterae.1